MSYKVGDIVRFRTFKDLHNEFGMSIIRIDYVPDFGCITNIAMCGHRFIISKVLSNGAEYRLKPVFEPGENINNCWFSEYITAVGYNNDYYFTALQYVRVYEEHFYKESEGISL